MEKEPQVPGGQERVVSCKTAWFLETLDKSLPYSVLLHLLNGVTQSPSRLGPSGANPQISTQQCAYDVIRSYDIIELLLSAK